jgi:hypothetical protein
LSETKQPNDALMLVESAIRKHHRAITSLERERDDLLSMTTVECVRRDCGLQFWVRDLTYIQTHWYVSPHGCTGGDYWNEGEGQWRCKCGHINRLYNKPEIQKLKRLFRDVENSYDRY